ncbi:MAG: mechanosensitive ion channel family protein [Synechococcaceae cyanobacterium]
MPHPLARSLLALAAALLLLLQNLPAMASDPAAWVLLEGQKVLEIRVAAGAQTPRELATRLSRGLLELARDTSINPNQLVVEEHPPYWMVSLRKGDGSSIPRVAVDARAATQAGISQKALAELYRDKLQAAVRQYRERHQPEAWLRGAALALLLLILYVAWIRWQRQLHRRLLRRIERYDKGWQLGSSQLLAPDQLRFGLHVGLESLHWSLLVLGSYLLVPLLLAQFPPTQILAAGLRSQLLGIVLAIGSRLFSALPSLGVIAFILGLTALAVRLSNAWFGALALGRIRVPGFYPEWGRPTGRICALLVVLIGLVICYPYIPGSNSKAFQGAGLFVGLLAALGSSAVATNVISGVMLIYTRGFNDGDRVEINGVLGVVQERSLLVTRIRTPRNELVSLPNASVISSPIVNYSFAEREIHQPLALATTVTIGYDVPWRQVHGLLLAAAGVVSGISPDPAPFVLQLSLNDFHISYELNATVRDVSLYRQTLSDLLAAIQDQFAAADVEILSPAYHAMRNGNPSTVPPCS